MLDEKKLNFRGRRLRGANSDRGFSLIEVLVSMLIFAFGVLGMVAMQARATQVSYDGEDRMRASLMANEIIAAMWEAGSVTAVTSNSALVTNWANRVKTPTVSGLPNGTGAISAPDANGVVTITITWQPPSRPTTSQYVTKLVIP